MPDTPTTPELTATLVVGRTSSRCGHCDKPTLIKPTHHIDVSGWTAQRGAGCGARFTGIDSDDRSSTADLLRELRPDLPVVGSAAAREQRAAEQPDLTDPVARLQAAADLVDRHATAPGITPPPWLSMDHGDRLLWDGPGADELPPRYVVDEPMSNPANAAYIALMDPEIGMAIAALLRAAARDAVEIGPDPHAVRLADALLTPSPGEGP